MNGFMWSTRCNTEVLFARCSAWCPLPPLLQPVLDQLQHSVQHLLHRGHHLRAALHPAPCSTWPARLFRQRWRTPCCLCFSLPLLLDGRCRVCGCVAEGQKPLGARVEESGGREGARPAAAHCTAARHAQQGRPAGGGPRSQRSRSMTAPSLYIMASTSVRNPSTESLDTTICARLSRRYHAISEVLAALTGGFS